MRLRERTGLVNCGVIPAQYPGHAKCWLYCLEDRIAFPQLDRLAAGIVALSFFGGVETEAPIARVSSSCSLRPAPTRVRSSAHRFHRCAERLPRGYAEPLKSRRVDAPESAKRTEGEISDVV